MEKIRVGLFDDHIFSAKGLSDFLIRSGITIVFVSTSKADLLEKVQVADIDILVLDISAPNVSGLELFEFFADNYNDINLVALTSLSSIMLVETLLSNGVKGFVNKRQDEGDILTCLERVYNDEIYLPKEYHFLTSKFRVSAPVTLSSREIEIIQLICKELTSHEIAEQLHLSFFTVENHRKNIFKKLGVRNIAGMIMAAGRLGHVS